MDLSVLVQHVTALEAQSRNDEMHLMEQATLHREVLTQLKAGMQYLALLALI